MSTIYPPRDFNGIAIADVLARIWTQNSDGVQVRMPSRADALRSLAHAVNYGLGRVPRIIGSGWRDGASAYSVTGTTDPLWELRRFDGCGNGRTLRITLLLLPRAVGTGDAEVYREGESADTTGVLEASSMVSASVAYPDDLYVASITVNRADAADALATLGITVVNGPRVCGWVVQDVERSSLETALHDYAPIAGPSSGEVCTTLYPEQLRAALQTLRSDYLPVVASWCADDCLAGSQPVSSDWTGLVITDTTPTNFLDGTSTSRTATTPGISVHCQHAGHGPTSEELGQVVRIDWSVLAATDDPTEATVTAIGPLGSYSVTVTGSAATWYDAADPVYCKSLIADDEASTARNKIDLHGSADAATYSVWLYGWRFEMRHE